MPSPDINEFDAIRSIVDAARGLSPASIRFVRARLLEILKGLESATPPTASDAPSLHVTAAQEKTAGLFTRRVEGE